MKLITTIVPFTEQAGVNIVTINELMSGIRVETYSTINMWQQQLGLIFDSVKHNPTFKIVFVLSHMSLSLLTSEHYQEH